MYTHDEFDRTIIAERTVQFRDQVARRLSGDLSEDEFRPLRLMNGVYLEMHAYMLRIAIPYGTLSSTQLRAIAHVARVYDRGYGHFTTRQNLQLNWVKLSELPDAIAELSKAGLHAIQTSGNCIRNITADPWAGVAPDEIEDPRIWAELLRQWSTLHPEFTFLPRKFKIAVTAAPDDRAATKVHDVGLRIVRNAQGEAGFEVSVGGGLGRSPFIGKTIREFLPTEDLLSYLEAVLRTYNACGRRDNNFKARVKFLVHDLGAERFAAEVEEEWARIGDSELKLDPETIRNIRSRFVYPDYEELEDGPEALTAALATNLRFALWHRNSAAKHKIPGYAIATLSLKPIGKPPGDATAGQMEAIAALADRYSHGEIRVSREQNLVFPHARQQDLPALWRELEALDLATPNAGLITDIVACPGLDYCSLANARSIPVAMEIAKRFSEHGQAESIGRLWIAISGCVNACGHHHIGHIGILGVEKNGREFYQITIGGRADGYAALGALVGPAIPFEEVTDTVERIVQRYLKLRRDAGETFIGTVERIGTAPFKEALHALH